MADTPQDRQRSGRKWSWSAAVRVLAAAFACAVMAFASEHPVPLENGTSDAKCLECHEAKTKGKSVHSAMKAGCSSCHAVTTKGETTSVDLNQAKEELCFTCHEREWDRFKHAPYEAGKCTVCHDPHASEFPKQLRATGNELCLGCHGEKKQDGAEVTLFGATQVPAAELSQIPKIHLSRDLTQGHPFETHPVSAEAKRSKSRPIDCESCHAVHAAPNAKLVTPGKEIPEDALNLARPALSPCIECHDTFDWGKGKIQPPSGWIAR